MPFGATLPFESGSLIAMIHVGGLPGTPRSSASVETLAAQAAREATLLQDAGFDAIIIENMHDAPYVHGRHGPEIVAAMTRVALEVQANCSLPLGVQILSGGNREAIAVAHSSAASFIRCENFTFAHVADEGLLAEAEAGPLLRYQRSIGAADVVILADIKKKHASHAITGDLSIEEAAEGAVFFGADAMIVTGASTAKPTDPSDVERVARATARPVLVGSGVTPDTVPELLRHAHALIVGSFIKRDGLWSNEPDPERCRAVVAAR